MLKCFLLALSSLFLLSIPANAHTYLGFDVPTPFLEQDFYDCVAGRLNWNQKAFAIVPYDPSGDFADEVSKAKKAGFREVHLLLDTDNFPYVDVKYLPNELLTTLQGKGTFVAGFWIRVSKDSRFFRVQRRNKEKLENLLDAFEAVFADYGGLSLGVYTTQADWMKVMGSPFNETTFNGDKKFKYWSAFDDDSTVCNADLNSSYCHFQQIQHDNNACGTPFNVNIKRFKAAVDEL